MHVHVQYTYLGQADESRGTDPSVDGVRSVQTHCEDASGRNAGAVG